MPLYEFANLISVTTSMPIDPDKALELLEAHDAIDAQGVFIYRGTVVVNLIKIGNALNDLIESQVVRDKEIDFSEICRDARSIRRDLKEYSV